MGLLALGIAQDSERERLGRGRSGVQPYARSRATPLRDRRAGVGRGEESGVGAALRLGAGRSGLCERSMGPPRASAGKGLLWLRRGLFASSGVIAGLAAQPWERVHGVPLEPAVTPTGATSTAYGRATTQGDTITAVPGANGVGGGQAKPERSEATPRQAMSPGSRSLLLSGERR